MPLCTSAPVAPHERTLLTCLVLISALPLAAQAVPTTGGAAFYVAAGVPAPLFLRTGDITPQLGQLAYTGPNLPTDPGFTVMTWIRPQATQFNWSSLFKFGTDPSVWGLYFIPGTTALHFNFMTSGGPGSVNTAPLALAMNSWSLVTLTSGPAGLDVYLNSSRVLNSPDRLATAPGSVYLTGKTFHPPTRSSATSAYGTRC